MEGRKTLLRIVICEDLALCCGKREQARRAKDQDGRIKCHQRESDEQDDKHVRSGLVNVLPVTHTSGL